MRSLIIVYSQPLHSETLAAKHGWQCENTPQFHVILARLNLVLPLLFVLGLLFPCFTVKHIVLEHEE